jgi:hypothetical protein
LALTGRISICATAVLLAVIGGAPTAAARGIDPAGVGAPATARASAPAAAYSSQANCEKRVQFALVDARTSGCLTLVSSSPNTWESSDTVQLNGIPLPPLPGTKLVLKAPTASAPGGSVSVRTTITLAGVKVFAGGFSYNLPAGGPGELKTLATISPPKGTKIKGFSLAGSASIQIGKDPTGDKQGYTRFELIVALPDIFKNGPDKNAGGLTGTVAIRTDASGVHADTLKIEVANAYVGQVLLKNVCLSYVSATSPTQPCQPPKFGATKLLECNTTGTDRWDGSALMTLPTAARPDIGLFAGTANGQFAYAGAQATNLGTSVPIVTGVYLDKIGIGICMQPPPMKIKGAAGIRFGPSFNGKQAAYLDGSIQYTDSRPWVIDARGSLTLFDKNVASGHLTYRADGAIDFGFSVNWNFYSVVDVSGGLNGWYQPSSTYTRYTLDLRDPVNQRRANDFNACVRDLRCLFNFGRLAAVRAEYDKIPRLPVQQTAPAKFDVFGSGRVCAVKVVCAGGDVAVSSVGVAGCAEVTVFGYPEPYLWGVRWVEVKARAGAGYRWGNGSHVDVMGQSCDVGPYRAQKSAVDAAAGVSRIQIARQPAVALKIAGLGRPPNVSIKGPGGREIVANGPGQLKRGKYYFVEDPQTNTTSVVLADPAPGIWTIRELPGSSPVAGVSQARVDPNPYAVGQVIGTGADRAIQYAAETDPSLAITFWERGQNYEQQLGPANGTPCMQNAPIQGPRPANAFMAQPKITCGVIPFSPAPGPGGTRQIVAVVTDHGVPVNEFNVTTYRTTGELGPARPSGLKLMRSGSNVTVTWNSAAGASNYNLDVTLSDGSKVLDVQGSRDRRVVLRGISPKLGVTVGVAGVDSDDVQGPSMTVRSAGL